MKLLLSILIPIALVWGMFWLNHELLPEGWGELWYAVPLVITEVLAAFFAFFPFIILVSSPSPGNKYDEYP